MGYFPLPLVLYIVLLSFIHYFTLTFRWTRVTPDTPKVRLWGNRLCSFLQDVVPLQKAVRQGKVWAQDDGSKCSNGFHLNTNAFSIEDLDLLLNVWLSLSS
jgi:hypothetical protein